MTRHATTSPATGEKARCVLLLEQATELACKEFEYLAADDSQALRDTAQRRAQLIEQAVALRNKEQVDRQLFLRHMQKLHALQASLTQKVTAAHEQTRAQLRQAGQENKRLHGYKQTRTTVPLHNTYLNKRS